MIIVRADRTRDFKKWMNQHDDINRKLVEVNKAIGAIEARKKKKGAVDTVESDADDEDTGNEADAPLVNS